MIVVGVVLAVRAGWVAMAPAPAVVDNFADDAYYYFGIAKNVWEVGLVSFDGLEPTSGFHPLWLANILPFFGLDLGSVGALRAVRLYSLVLYGVTILVAGRYLFARYGILGATASLCFGLTAANDIFGVGMETSLALPLAVAALAYAESRCLAPDTSDALDGRFLLLGVMLALLQLARLDAVWLVGIVVGIVCLSHARREGTSLLRIGNIGGRMVTPIVVSGVAYLMFNYWSTGHPVPISAQVKTLGDPLLNWKFLWLLTHSSDWIPLAMAAVGSLLWAGSMVWSQTASQGPMRPRDASSVITALFVVVFVGMNLASSTWGPWTWYRYPLVLFGFFTLPRIFEEATVADLSARWRTGGAAVLFVLTLAYAPVVQFIDAPDRPAGSFRLLNRAVAEEMSDDLPRETVVAMAERAGSFGYFFEGHLLHIEGLVGTQDTLAALRNEKISDFLDRKGVDFLADYERLEEQYSEATIEVPNPVHHLGPVSRIRVCRERQRMSRALEGAEVADTPLRVWRWPACQRTAPD